jgi:hypothetical protein
VDSKFVLNPINPTTKETDIAMKGDISTNMTKLGIHMKISGGGYTFVSLKLLGLINCEFKVVGSDKLRESITEFCRWS